MITADLNCWEGGHVWVAAAGGGAAGLSPQENSSPENPCGHWSFDVLLPIIVAAPSPPKRGHPELQIYFPYVLHWLGGCVASGLIYGLVGRSRGCGR